MNLFKKFMQLLRRDSTHAYSQITIKNGAFVHQLTTDDPTRVANALLAQASIAAQGRHSDDTFLVVAVVLQLGGEILPEYQWHVLIAGLAPPDIELTSTNEVKRAEPNIREYEYTFCKKHPRPR